MAKILTSAREIENMARRLMNDPALGHLEVRPDPVEGFRFHSLSDHLHGERLEQIAVRLRASFGLKEPRRLEPAAPSLRRQILDRSRPGERSR